MNKSFLSVLAFAVATPFLYAQTSTGNMMVGGAVDFTSVSREGGSVNDMSSFTFAPSFGYFVSDNLAVGATLTLGTERSGTGSAKTTRTSFGLGPFARYYKFTSNDRFAFFGQAGLTISTGKTDPPVGDVAKSSAVTFSLFPGAAYFFNEHWALELAITGFQITSSDPDTGTDDNKVTSVDFDIRSFSPSIGMRYHF